MSWRLTPEPSALFLLCSSITLPESRYVVGVPAPFLPPLVRLLRSESHYPNIEVGTVLNTTNCALPRAPSPHSARRARLPLLVLQVSLDRLQCGCDRRHHAAGTCGSGQEIRARETVGGSRQAHGSDTIMHLDREPINTRFRYPVVLDVGPIRSGRSDSGFVQRTGICMRGRPYIPPGHWIYPGRRTESLRGG